MFALLCKGLLQIQDESNGRSLATALVVIAIHPKTVEQENDILSKMPEAREDGIGYFLKQFR